MEISNANPPQVSANPVIKIKTIMHILCSKSFIPLFLCIFLLTFSIPVQAQESSPAAETASETPTPNSTTQTPENTPAGTHTVTLTPSGTSSENKATETPPLSSETPTPVSSLTQTTDTTPAISPTPIPPATTSTIATVQPTSKPPVSCQMDNVYKSQIIISYNSAPLPKPSVNYTVVENFTSGDGIETSVLHVNKEDFCQALNELQKNKRVILAEPNYSITLLETTPNDPDFSLQYYLNNIRAPRGWDFTTGSPAVTIAILDTGIDLAHVDLAGKLVPGFDFVYDDEIPQDENGHGTLVAGIAAAITNNGVGMAGVSWGAQIMPLRVLDAAGNGSYTNLAEAIIWATDNGARVINMSVGGVNYSETLEEAVDYAVKQGAILVAATGNTGASTVLYPAALPGVIGVGATDSSNHLASFSNTGAGVDVVAPGVSIFSTYPGNIYRYSSGTSMAAPQVAGFAALLASLPELPYSSQIVDMIESSAKDLGRSGRDSSYGHGLIQVGPAIRSVVEGDFTATPTSKSHKQVPSLTPTGIPPQIFFIPSEFPTQILPGAGTDAGFSTPTPGEVFMLQNTVPAASPTESSTIPIQSLQPTQTPSIDEVKENKSLFLLILGIVYIISGLALFIYTRRSFR
ncbi:MAG: S8 family serine peptidase [Chloroflexi bacterium]|nr:S8 family serine peptidase [Chloroflexota bacterium]